MINIICAYVLLKLTLFILIYELDLKVTQKRLRLLDELYEEYAEV